MIDKSPTPEELQRIDRGEDEYGDDDWAICDQCGGSGNYPFGTDEVCLKCKSYGEIKRHEKDN